MSKVVTKRYSLGSLMTRLREKNDITKDINTVYSVTNKMGIVNSNDYHEYEKYSSDLSNYLVLRKGNFAYNPARLNVGSIAWLKKEEPGLVSPMYVIFQLNNDLILNDYFEYLLSSSRVFNNMISFVEQGARFRFDYSNWNKIFVNIPSIEVQRKIIKKLDVLSNNILSVEKMLEYRNSQFEYYRDLLYKEDDKSLTSLSSIIFSQKKKNIDLKCQNAYSITQSGLIPTKDFFGDVKQITSDNTSGYYVVEKNWFVYSPSRIDVGSIGYLKEQGPVIVSPLDVVFSINEDKIIPEYLLNYILSSIGMNKILNNRKGIAGTGRRTLSFSDFAKISMLVPSIEKQQEVINNILKFKENINLLKENILLRKSQFDYYRDKLLSFEELSVSE